MSKLTEPKLRIWTLGGCWRWALANVDSTRTVHPQSRVKLAETRSGDASRTHTREVLLSCDGRKDYRSFGYSSPHVGPIELTGSLTGPLGAVRELGERTTLERWISSDQLFLWIIGPTAAQQPWLAPLLACFPFIGKE
ncbi:hypothetical protein VTN77DRAFT_2824 [Rasamsonia byssochlamydoides]|uniref:uncharacterized protein n=1 Tax=Rasamsonia byssochlamydoides TaxID=89139 RepID=UPI0037444292